MATTVTVKVYFEAAHRLHNPDKPDEWNREVYGKCNNPHGHGHNYALEVAVGGEAFYNWTVDMEAKLAAKEQE